MSDTPTESLDAVEELSPAKAREAELDKYVEARALIKDVHRLAERVEQISATAARLEIGNGYPSQGFPTKEMVEMWGAAVSELRTAIDAIPPAKQSG